MAVKFYQNKILVLDTLFYNIYSKKGLCVFVFANYKFEIGGSIFVVEVV